MTELYNEPSYDELKDVLQTFLNPSDDTQTTTATANTTTTEQVATQTATTAKTDVSDAFDSLFNS